jgi:hypothetical protein
MARELSGHACYAGAVEKSRVTLPAHRIKKNRKQKQGVIDEVQLIIHTI